MSSNWPEVRKIVNAALDQPPDKRQAYAKQACGNDAALREAVWSLLNDDSVPEGFLEPPIEGAAVQLAVGSADRAAAIEHMGRYRVTEVIDSGGIGTVYRAVPSDDENAPAVAVKVLKRGMTGEDMQRRFRQEQEVLARLKHRNIARFIDGGVTSGGLPYLVMEFIEGRPIDRFCDQKKLAVSDRLELFEDVCSAVQYSHRNLVVHRDLKPRNILVTDDGVPKLLDFGIAKLLEDGSSGPAPDPTVTANRMITPQYASPEQIKGAPISTATDVYSLGVVLYELLTGHRPYDLRGKARGEILELIGEADPTSPSTQVMQTEEVTYLDGSTTTVTPELVSVARGTDPQGLRRTLTGDLDTIVLTAMHKDPDRRYASVERLAEDLRRYRTGLPILARADTFSYRARKFIRRNKAATIAATVAFVSLLAGTTGLAVGLQRAHGAQQQLKTEAEIARLEARKAARIKQFLQEILAAADPRTEEASISVRELLDNTAQRIEVELTNEPAVRASVQDTIGNAYLGLGAYDIAEKHLREASRVRESLPETSDIEIAQSLRSLARLLHYQGKEDQVRPLLMRSLSLLSTGNNETHRDMALTLSALGGTELAAGRFKEAEQRFRQLLKLLDESTDSDSPEYANTLNNVGIALKEQGRYDEAETLYKEALEISRRVAGNRHPEVARTLNNLAILSKIRGDYVKAEAWYLEALEALRARFGPNHYKVIVVLNNLAACLKSRWDLERANEYSLEALQHARRGFGDEHPLVADCLHTRSTILRVQDRPTEAIALCREALKIRRAVLGNEHPRIAQSLSSLGLMLKAEGRLDDADAAYREALSVYRIALGDAHPSVAVILNNLSLVVRETGDLADAERLQREAWTINRQSLGPDNPTTLTDVYNLALLFVKMDRLDEAEELFGSVVESRRTVLPPDHPDIASGLGELGFLRLRRDDAVGAELLLRECCSIRESSLGAQHWKTRNCESILGECLSALGDYAQAESLLLPSYDVIRNFKGDKDGKTVAVLERIVNLYDSWGKPEKAAEYRALLEEATGDDDSEDEGEEPASDAKTEPAQAAGEAPEAPSSTEGGGGESP